MTKNEDFILKEFVDLTQNFIDRKQFNKTLTKKLIHYFPSGNEKTNEYKNTK